eukprot:774384-Amorphochlora_amoeboformis.AAC.1
MNTCKCSRLHSHTQIKKTFFREQELANKTIEYVMVPWYHGFLSEKQLSEILLNQENAEKFLVREPRNR